MGLISHDSCLQSGPFTWLSSPCTKSKSAPLHMHTLRLSQAVRNHPRPKAKSPSRDGCTAENGCAEHAVYLNLLRTPFAQEVLHRTNVFCTAEERVDRQAWEPRLLFFEVAAELPSKLMVLEEEGIGQGVALLQEVVQQHLQLLRGHRVRNIKQGACTKPCPISTFHPKPRQNPLNIIQVTRTPCITHTI